MNFDLLKAVAVTVMVALSTSAVGCSNSGTSGRDSFSMSIDSMPSDSTAIDTVITVDSDAVANEEVIPYALKIRDITPFITFGYKEADRGHDDIDIIVVHSNYHVVSKARQIYDFDTEGCIDQFRQGRVAPHYMIERDGTVLMMVREKNIAWHAGRSELPDGSRKWLNATSIGIEVISMKRDGPTEAQYRSLDMLLKDICSRYDIRYLVRHSDIAPGRKDDPWGMDWQRVADSVKVEYPKVRTFDVPVTNNPEFK